MWQRVCLLREGRGRRFEHGVLGDSRLGDDRFEQAANGITIEGAFVELDDPGDNLRLTLGDVDGELGAALEHPDLDSTVGTAIKEVEELVVELVDFVAPGGDLIVHSTTVAGANDGGYSRPWA